jgi:hypothetical protein
VFLFRHALRRDEVINDNWDKNSELLLTLWLIFLFGGGWSHETSTMCNKEEVLGRATRGLITLYKENNKLRD